MSKRVVSTKQARRAERGLQLFELALVLPILLVLIVAAAEFGRYFYTYAALSRATRAGARYLARRAYTTDEVTKAKNLAVCGSLSTTACSSGAAVAPGLTASNIQITTTGGSLLPETVTVQIINYSYQPVFNLGAWVGGSWASVAVSPSTTMRYLLEN
jgi:Flp pilus assembly protein TadG